MMGWYFSPQKPGAEFGPCAGPCKHKDCAQMHRQAAALCRICQQPIGWGARVYFEEGNKAVHARCAEDEVDRKGVAHGTQSHRLHTSGQ